MRRMASQSQSRRSGARAFLRALALLAAGAACFFVVAAPAPARSGDVLSWNIVRGPDNDGYECIAPVPAGVVAAGFTDGITRDALINLNSGANRNLGRLIWTNPLPGYDDFVTDMAVDGAGAAIAVGFTMADADADAMVVKAGPDAALAWAVTLDWAGGDDAFYDVVCDDAGDVYAAGYRGVGQDTDMWLVKLDGSDGQLLWQAADDNGGPEMGTGLCRDARGNVYVTGESANTAAQQATRGPSDVATVMYDSTGAQQWVVRSDGRQHGAERPDAIVLGTSGALFVAGTAYGDRADEADFLLLRLATSGTRVWQRELDDRSHWEDTALALQVGKGNSAYVAGAAGAVGVRASRGIVARWAGSGALLWKKEWAAPGGRAFFNDMVINGAGTVWCAGATTRAQHTRDLEAVVCKYTAAGRRLWHTMWEGPGRLDDTFSSLTLQGSGAVFAAGATESRDLDYDAVIVKLAR